MKIRTFEDLEIWQEGKALASDTFKMWKGIDSRGYYNLQDQMQRSALSIPSNIAEGSERKSKLEFQRFLYIAKGSAGEFRTQLYVMKDLDLIADKTIDDLINRAMITSKRIAALIMKLNSSK